MSSKPVADPGTNVIRTVPASRFHGDEARIADGSGPIDSLPLKVAPEIKTAEVSIDHRAMQLDDDLESIAGSEVQGIEEIQERRIIEKLCKPCTTAIGAVVNASEIHV